MLMLQHREVDFVLAYRPSYRVEGIESHMLFDNQLSVVVNLDHPLAKQQKVSLQDLERFNVALPSKGLQARNKLDNVLKNHLCNLNIRIELNEVNILLKMIRQSNLVTILSEATIHNEPGVKAIPLDLPNIGMHGCIHILKNAYRKQSMIAFIRMLTESNAIKERIRDWID